MLIVQGNVATPEACYNVRLSRGGLTATQPPSQYFELDIERAAGLCPQTSGVLSVNAQVPAQPSYRSVVILCSGSRIAEISQISRVRKLKPETAK